MADIPPAETPTRADLVLRLLTLADLTAYPEVRAAALAEVKAVQHPPLAISTPSGVDLSKYFSAGWPPGQEIKDGVLQPPTNNAAGTFPPEPFPGRGYGL